MFGRRDWIKTSLLSLPLAAQVARASEEGCGIAIGTYGLQSMPLSDAIDFVARTGFNALEITVFPDTTGDPSVHLDSKEQLRSIRDQVSDSGLRLCALMADLKPQEDEVKHQEQLSDLRKLIELAHALSPDNPPLIQTVLGGKIWDESRALFRDRLADWNQILSDLKGRLSIKPHRSNAMSLPEEAQWLLDQLGNPRRLKMVYDYSHYAFLDPEKTIAETVESALPISNYVAVKDAYVVDGKVRFDLVGESRNWDHADIVRTFFEGGYRGDFCCEVSSQIWRTDLYNPQEATRTCFENLKAAFERAGVKPV